jgi:hypothetical protein
LQRIWKFWSFFLAEAPPDGINYFRQSQKTNSILRHNFFSQIKYTRWIAKHFKSTTTKKEREKKIIKINQLTFSTLESLSLILYNQISCLDGFDSSIYCCYQFCCWIKTNKKGGVTTVTSDLFSRPRSKPVPANLLWGFHCFRT